MRALTTPVDLPAAASPGTRGILGVVPAAPEGWELGGVEFQYICPDPVVRDKCVASTDTPARIESEKFNTFMIEQGVTCSTMGASTGERLAREALFSVTDYALGKTLRDGIAAPGNPSLNDAVDLGQYPNVIDAVAALECYATARPGNEYVLHASPGAAAYLVAEGLLNDFGRSPSGALWVVSQGYECATDATHHRIWITGRVFASAGDVTSQVLVGKKTNDRDAWAYRSVIVGFNPCLNATAEFALATQNGGNGGPVNIADVEGLQDALDALQAGKANAPIQQSDVQGLDITLDEKADRLWVLGQLDTKASLNHAHAAADINSGTLAAARIPNLATSKVTGLDAALNSKVESVVAGTGIAVDVTDPKNPVVSTV